LTGTTPGASLPRADQIVALDDLRFTREHVHHALVALDERGIRLDRFQHVPDDTAAWIDAEFGGWTSPLVAGAGVWLASTRDSGRRIAIAAYDVRAPRHARLRAYSVDRELGIVCPLCVLPEYTQDAELCETMRHAALFSLRERGYRKALIPGAEQFSSATRRSYRATLLASGGGSNVQAVLDGVASGALPLEIGAVVVNRPNAPVIERARRAGVPVCVVGWDRESESRARYDARVLAAVADSRPDLVLTLGWMHVLAPEFITAFPELINVHPAFLPLDPARDTVTMPDGTVIPVFRGAHALRDSLAAGSPWAGASVHYVTNEVDRGEVLVRTPLRVKPGEEEPELLARLHVYEHRAVELAIERWICER
jgi:phosphoribosylglycinamide formyltransferase-1